MGINIPNATVIDTYIRYIAFKPIIKHSSSYKRTKQCKGKQSGAQIIIQPHK